MGAKTKIALSGFIGNTHDALIVFEGECCGTYSRRIRTRTLRKTGRLIQVLTSTHPACRRGLLPRAIGRLSEAERKAIKSGDIYVFNEEESQIKR